MSMKEALLSGKRTAGGWLSGAARPGRATRPGGPAAALALLAASALAAGCQRAEPSPRGERSSEPRAFEAAPPAPPAPAVKPAPPAPPAPALGPPTYDLLANRERFHQTRAGLSLRLAGEGVRLYDLALRDVWDAPVDGARRLRGKARLLLPWPGGPAELLVRGRGKLALSLDGKKRTTVTASAAGARVALGELAAGERELGLEPKGATSLASLELAAPGAADPCAAAAPAELAPAPGAPLRGARRFEIFVELPERARLAFAPQGGGEAVVSLRGEDGARRVLWQGKADGQRRVLPLDLAPQIAALSFESPACDVAWHELGLGAAPPPSSPSSPSSATAAAPRAPQPRHLILLVVDTLRADRLAAIAKTAVATPRLTAALARGGAVFTRNLSVAPSSPPSHTTLHTGLVPRVHGVVGDVTQLSPEAPMLSALLAARGFFAGYVGNNDFAMGRLKKAARWTEQHAPVFEDQGIDCAPIVERALQMSAAAVAKGQRMFLTLLPIEPHVPYRFHAGITERYFAGPYASPLGKRVTSAHLGRVRAKGLPPAGWQQLRALYDGEVTYFDQCYGALEDGLAKLGILDETAIVLTSDHGEGMGERGNNTGHAYSLNHELTWVPLLVFGGPFTRTSGAAGKAPGSAKAPSVRRWTSATSGVDLAPTVLELLGQPADPRMQGHSLAPILRGETPWPRAVASEYGKAYATATSGWHYVADYEGRGKLFDVKNDPAELRDRSADAAVPLRYLREAAAAYLSHRTRWRASDGSWTNWTTGGGSGGGLGEPSGQP